MYTHNAVKIDKIYIILHQDYTKTTIVYIDNIQKTRFSSEELLHKT